jgi:hypothetical protein
MLTAVNHLASLQANPTVAVLSAADRLMQYAASYPNHELVFHACPMILCASSDASYLSRSKSRSVAGGHLACGDPTELNNHNGAILAISEIIPTVVASAAEAEYAAVYILGCEAEPIRETLNFLGYQQPSTIIQCDNQCAVGIANDSVKIKRSKAIDMRYHWIRDRIKQGHFKVIWQKGSTNIADFFTKALPVHRHQELKSILVQSKPQPFNASLNKRAVMYQRFRQSKEQLPIHSRA